MPFLCILLSEIPFYTSFILMFNPMFPPCTSVSSQLWSDPTGKRLCSDRFYTFAHVCRQGFPKKLLLAFQCDLIFFSLPTWGVTVFDAVQDFSINVFIHYYHKTSMYIKHLMGDLLNHYNAVLFTWFAHLHHVTTKLKPPLVLAEVH